MNAWARATLPLLLLPPPAACQGPLGFEPFDPTTGPLSPSVVQNRAAAVCGTCTELQEIYEPFDRESGGRGGAKRAGRRQQTSNRLTSRENGRS